MKFSAKTLTICGVIAAAYSALTYISAAFGLAYGPIQFRISEALTILPLFTPAAIPGLTIGCLLSNFASFNPIDLIFGTLATFLAAITTRAMRNITTLKVPLLSILAPVFFNAIIVGVEISVFYLGGFTVYGFLISALQVGLGELAVLCFLGIPLTVGLKRVDNKLFK